MWFYMPLMHSESLADHESFESIVSQFSGDMKERGDKAAVAFLENNLDIEKRHLDIIEQFRRYSYRNKVMGRELMGGREIMARGSGRDVWDMIKGRLAHP